MSDGNIFAGHLSLSTKSGFMFKNFFFPDSTFSHGANAWQRVLVGSDDFLISCVRRTMLLVLLGYCGTTRAQQITISEVTPSSVCVGSNFSVTISFKDLSAPASLRFLFTSPGVSDLEIGELTIMVSSGSFPFGGKLPLDLLPGTYKLKVNLVYMGWPFPLVTYPSNSFTVNALPPAPIVSDVAYCQGATPMPLPSGNAQNPVWYVSSSGGVGSTVAPAPPTSAAGVKNYYVSQKVNGCEGPRADIAVTINPTPELTILPTDQELFNGAETIAVNFNGSIDGTEFSWSNDNTATGLAAIGVGVTGIPAFVTTGAGTSTVTVTPTLGSCAGTPVSFKIKVSDKTPDLRPYLIVENPGFSNEQTTSNVFVRIRNMTAETTALGLVTIHVNKPTEESTLVLTPASAENWTLTLGTNGTHYVLTSNVSIPAGPLGVKIEGILTMPSESPIGKYNLDAAISAGSAGEALADDGNNGIETLVFKN